MAGLQNGETHSNLQYLLAWTTRSRDSVLKAEIALKARQLIRDVCVIHEVKIVRGVIAPDNVQLEISCSPTVTPAALIEDLKDRTLRGLETAFPELKQQYWGLPIWSGGYLCLSIGDKTTEQLNEYLDAKSPADDDTFQVVPAP